MRGGHFAPHTDGRVETHMDYQSLYTVILYLNDCKEGGATSLMKDSQVWFYSPSPPTHFQQPPPSFLSKNPSILTTLNSILNKNNFSFHQLNVRSTGISRGYIDKRIEATKKRRSKNTSPTPEKKAIKNYSTPEVETPRANPRDVLRCAM